MFDKFLGSLLGTGSKADARNNREHDRRAGDQCVSIVGGKMYPVRNWSAGGLLIAGDERMFGVDEELDVTLKFKLRDEVLDISHKARIVRKGYGNVALQFAPLSAAVQAGFQKVMDDVLAQSFGESQLI